MNMTDTFPLLADCCILGFLAVVIMILKKVAKDAELDQSTERTHRSY